MQGRNPTYDSHNDQKDESHRPKKGGGSFLAALPIP